MNFYDIPTTLEKEIDDLEKSITQFINGALHPTKFRAIRVPFGVYEQRQENTFMLRIRTTAGGITPVQLEKAAQIAKLYAKPMLHITTRQELQIHDARLEDIPCIMRQLLSVGLSCRGGGGNTVRNIMASCDAGIHPLELFDVTPHAVALSTRLIAEADSWNFPRKLKISFSSTREDNALAAFNDLGFIAKIKDWQKGFQVFIAGGLGCRPRISKVLHEFIPETLVWHVTLAVKNLYLIHGNRKSKNSARLRFLWEELGKKTFIELYEKEFEKIKDSLKLELNEDRFFNKNETVKLAPRFINIAAFDVWKKRFVENQRQDDLKSVLIPIPAGDLFSDDAVHLSRFLKNFGENVIRLTMTQNILVRNIPYEYLGNLFELVNEIKSESHFPVAFANITVCAGADTCTTGVCLPKGVVPVIKKYLAASNTPDSLEKDFRINISGCPNSCAQHHISDLGAFGRVARSNGRALPGYWIVAGGDRNPQTRSFAEKCGWIPARNLPEAICKILEKYSLVRENYTGFYDYFKHTGKAEITTICKKFSTMIPYFYKDETYYFDWGAKKVFTTALMGHSECSAGVYDMIEVEMKSIQKNLKQLELPEFKHLEKQILWNIVYSGASMLLVTRGIDPETEAQIFSSFKNFFIQKNLVDKKFERLIDDAVQKKYEKLSAASSLVKEFGQAIVKLYHLMDNTLRFPGEGINIPRAPEDVKTEDRKHDFFKDLRNVACPMNFVKTKVELSKIESGDRLKIYLDDGEPIDNVPRSVLGEGHKILEQKKTNGYWKVVIEKQ
ncbi:MAG: sulfurtransferase TusA family protein [Proteobacteria bacterium]|nr:sulfurtransferase TusA family protein [Pseudomonadota bacterium]